MTAGQLEPERIRLADLESRIPPEWSDDVRRQLDDELLRRGEKVVVLDDDPTGTQTVHDIPVLTAWSADLLDREFDDEASAFFILTNSRSVTANAARDLNEQIGRRLVDSARNTGRPFTVISRSDSTLRGHFPDEVDGLIEGIGRKPDLLTVIPCFFEGGRLTLNDCHYVQEGDVLVPAAQTEFASDPAFGYSTSHLPSWIAEKTRGRTRASEVATITLEDIRVGGPDRVRGKLSRLEPGTTCVVNSCSYRDLEVFTLGLLWATTGGREVLCRTAASYVSVRSGIRAEAGLSAADLPAISDNGGLVVAGSFVPRTTAQLAELKRTSKAEFVEISVAALLDPAKRVREIRRATACIDDHLRGGNSVVLFTSREHVGGGKDGQESLETGRQVSSGVVEVVRNIQTVPRYLVAKGGITSSEIATGALNVKRAMIIGQILPGVPVWSLGPESRYPDLRYVVFPGNVGDERALLDVYERLEAGPINPIKKTRIISE